MPIRFRRRLRLAPGVYINFSKSGLSATIGKRGASLTLNSQGLYGNVGIPGTGLSYRTRILKPQKNVDQEIGHSTKQINNPTPNAITYFKQLPSVYEKNDALPIKRDKGIGMIILGVLLLVVAALLWLSGMRDPIVLGIIAGCVLFSILFLWIGIDRARSYNNMDTTNINNLKKVNQILEKSKFMSPLQVEILEETKKYLEIASQIDTINAALIKLQKRQTKRNREKLFQLNEQLESLKNSLQECGIIADGDLTKPQLDAYQQFCCKMRKVKEYDGIWKYLSEKSYSIARMTEDTFSVLKYIEKVPTIVANTETIYFYPKYIIKAKSCCDFDILEWKDAQFIWDMRSVPVPQSDVDKFINIRKSFLHETKNGQPDRRYSSNAMRAEATVGLLGIKNFNVQYYFNDAFVSQDINNSIREYIKILNKKHVMLSKEYFDTLVSAILKLTDFYSVLCNDSNFRTIIKRTMNISSEAKISDSINIMLQYDIIQCYSNIKQKVDFESKEGIALSLVILHLIHPNGHLSYDNYWEIITNSTMKNLQETVIELAQQTKMQKQWEDKLYTLLYSYDKEACYQFLILFYRIISIIAKADGTISNEEAMALSRIVILKDNIERTENNNYREIPPLGNDNETMGETTKRLIDEPYLADIARFIVENKNAQISTIHEHFKLDYEKIMDIRDFLSNNGIHPWISREELHEKLISMGLEDYSIPKQKGQEASTSTIPTLHKTIYNSSNLDELIGLASVKKEVKTLTNFIKIQQHRVAQGMKVPSISFHCVFTGNPGTGKTTVARIIAEIYKDLGILRKGHLVETDRAGLVAEYVGQTAVKTNNKIDEALDGILFIDEAYSLSEGGANDFGKEAIATLLKRMEDDRDRLVVILAGYTNEMKGFIDINPGLQSRFNRYIDFPDYTADELVQIFDANLKKFDYKMNDDSKKVITTFFENAVNHKDKNFGNARFARNVFEKTLERQANRLAYKNNISNNDLITIDVEDLPIN